MLRMFYQFMERGGGLIMWSIFSVSVVIWGTGILRFYFLMNIKKARKRFFKAIEEGNKKKCLPVLLLTILY